MSFQGMGNVSSARLNLSKLGLESKKMLPNVSMTKEEV
jgi:hypothetical protein